jgi:regulator of nucleoside diphosphate kinase
MVQAGWAGARAAASFFGVELISEAVMESNLIISVRDARRLEALLAGPAAKGSSVAPLLEAELVRAELREPADIPPDTVTMHSEVVCVEESSGVQHRLRLVYPNETGDAVGNVSVLAPLGAALIGLSVGSAIDWPLPGGRTARVRVAEVLWQPEKGDGGNQG